MHSDSFFLSALKKSEVIFVFWPFQNNAGQALMNEWGGERNFEKPFAADSHSHHFTPLHFGHFGCCLRI